jgi:hypothetical protein
MRPQEHSGSQQCYSCVCPSSEKKFVCVTCGDDLHPERAEKYHYCMKPECQAKNLKGLAMVAVGVNKSAEQYLLLDEDTKSDLARGKYHDQRRGTFGPPEPGTARPAAPQIRGGPAQGSPAQGTPAQGGPAQGSPAQATPPRGTPAQGGAPQATPPQGTPAHATPPQATPHRGRPASPGQPRLPGTASQRRLAVLYNQQGLRPDEIASKLGLSRYDVTQIILAARSRGLA